MFSKVNGSSNVQATDGSVLYSERQNHQNSLDDNSNVVHGFEEHVEPSSSRNNTILASQTSSNDPDHLNNSSMHPPQMGTNMAYQYRTTTNGSPNRLQPPRALK